MREELERWQRVLRERARLGRYLRQLYQEGTIDRLEMELRLEKLGGANSVSACAMWADIEQRDWIEARLAKAANQAAARGDGLGGGLSWPGSRR